MTEQIWDGDFRSHRNNSFTMGMVSRILHTEKYTGKCMYGGTQYDHIVPRTLDDETFARAAKRLAENKFKSGQVGTGENLY